MFLTRHFCHISRLKVGGKPIDTKGQRATAQDRGAFDCERDDNFFSRKAWSTYESTTVAIVNTNKNLDCSEVEMASSMVARRCLKSSKVIS